MAVVELGGDEKLDRTKSQVRHVQVDTREMFRDLRDQYAVLYDHIHQARTTKARLQALIREHLDVVRGSGNVEATAASSECRVTGSPTRSESGRFLVEADRACVENELEFVRSLVDKMTV